MKTSLFSLNEVISTGTATGKTITIPENTKLLIFDIDYYLNDSYNWEATHLVDCRNTDTDDGYQPLYIGGGKVQFYFTNFTKDFTVDLKKIKRENNIKFVLKEEINKLVLDFYLNNEKIGTLETNTNEAKKILNGTYDVYIGRRFEENNGNLNKIDGKGSIKRFEVSYIIPTISKDYKFNGYSIDEIAEKNSITISGLETENIVENEYSYINTTNKDGSESVGKFLKILDHDINIEETFFVRDDEIYNPEKCFKWNMFSRLGDLGSDIFRSNINKTNNEGEYEFILIYNPNEITDNQLILHWSQTDNALKQHTETQGAGDDTAPLAGYREISIPSTISKDSYWREGIGKSTNDSYLDSLPRGTFWWGGIGCFKSHNGGFPAPDGNSYKHQQLWIRIDNTPYDAYAAIGKNCVYMDEINEEI